MWFGQDLGWIDSIHSDTDLGFVWGLGPAACQERMLRMYGVDRDICGAMF